MSSDTIYDFNLGEPVRDIITEIEGKVIAQCTFLNGCVQYGIKQKAKPDGTVLPTQYVDENQLVSIEAPIKPKSSGGRRGGGGGPADTPGPSCDAPMNDYYGDGDGVDALL